LASLASLAPFEVPECLAPDLPSPTAMKNGGRQLSDHEAFIRFAREFGHSWQEKVDQHCN